MFVYKEFSRKKTGFNRENMKVFIIGQSNTGKSFLFNQLCEKNIAITQNEINTTVDLISYKMGETILFDTPGIVEKSLPANADVFLYKIRDSGIEEFDQDILKTIYKTDAKVIIVYKNPSDLPSVEKYSTSQIEELRCRLNLSSKEKINKPMVAIIGRENSGKSTLMNSILGYSRCKVSPMPGTTKDSIIEESVHFQFVDTAGYCKEKTYMQTLIAQKRKEILQECDGVVLLLDGSQNLTRMEKQMVEECKKYSNFFTVAVNKKDLMNLKSQYEFDKFNSNNILMCNICAKENNIAPLLRNLFKSYNNSKKNIPTSMLNAWLSECHFKLFDSRNIPIKVKYIVQCGTRPIKFKYFALRKLHERCEKFILKEINKRFKLEGTNLKILFANK